jgi:hypothetical protein
MHEVDIPPIFHIDVIYMLRQRMSIIDMAGYGLEPQ